MGLLPEHRYHALYWIYIPVWTFFIFLGVGVACLEKNLFFFWLFYRHFFEPSSSKTIIFLVSALAKYPFQGFIYFIFLYPRISARRLVVLFWDVVIFPRYHMCFSSDSIFNWSPTLLLCLNSVLTKSSDNALDIDSIFLVFFSVEASFSIRNHWYL